MRVCATVCSCLRSEPGVFSARGGSSGGGELSAGIGSGDGGHSSPCLTSNDVAVLLTDVPMTSGDVAFVEFAAAAAAAAVRDLKS